jgi:hypothetical protein
MGPFKCPDCGIWWAGFEHRCAPAVSTTGSVTIEPRRVTVTPYLVCTCGNIPPNYVGDWFCPVHSPQWTATVMTFGDTNRAWFPKMTMTNAIAGAQTVTPRGVRPI